MGINGGSLIISKANELHWWRPSISLDALEAAPDGYIFLIHKERIQKVNNYVIWIGFRSKVNYLCLLISVFKKTYKPEHRGCKGKTQTNI